MSQFAQRGSVRIIWRSFELDSDAPRQRPGTLEGYLSCKYGVSAAEAAAMNTCMIAVAKEAGLEYRLPTPGPATLSMRTDCCIWPPSANSATGRSSARCMPFFVFDDWFGVSGAQPVEVFTEAPNQTRYAEKSVRGAKRLVMPDRFVPGPDGRTGGIICHGYSSLLIMVIYRE